MPLSVARFSIYSSSSSLTSTFDDIAKQPTMSTDTKRQDRAGTDDYSGDEDETLKERNVVCGFLSLIFNTLPSFAFFYIARRLQADTSVECNRLCKLSINYALYFPLHHARHPFPLCYNVSTELLLIYSTLARETIAMSFIFISTPLLPRFSRDSQRTG